MHRSLIATAAFVLATSAWAHLTPNSLKPTGGATYHPGDTVTVSWNVDIVHDGFNVDFSSDSGKTWTTSLANLPDKTTGAHTAKWIVPNKPTQHGRLRLCQKQGTAVCTDANNVSIPSGKPVGVGPYVMVSGTFTVAAPVAIAPGHAEAARSLRATGPGSLDLAFSLASEGAVSLIAFDATGREAAVLLQARYPAGFHRVALFSESLRAHPEWVLRLNGAEAR
jgi:hypothetical protein